MINTVIWHSQTCRSASSCSELYFSWYPSFKNILKALRFALNKEVMEGDPYCNRIPKSMRKGSRENISAKSVREHPEQSRKCYQIVLHGAKLHTEMQRAWSQLLPAHSSPFYFRNFILFGYVGREASSTILKSNIYILKDTEIVIMWHFQVLFWNEFSPKLIKVPTVYHSNEGCGFVFFYLCTQNEERITNSLLIQA